MSFHLNKLKQVHLCDPMHVGHNPNKIGGSALSHKTKSLYIHGQSICTAHNTSNRQDRMEEGSDQPSEVVWIYPIRFVIYD